jgi:hypothetical protein
MEAIKVWFPINNIFTDTLNHICGAAYSGIPVYPLPASLAPYCWIEEDTDGQLKFCTFKVSETYPGTGLQAGFNDPVTGMYHVTAKPFSAVQIGDKIVFKPQ